jgi:hypothetical protein
MDPYIEAADLWEDFHNALVAEIKGIVADALPRGYVARTRTRSYTVARYGEQALAPDLTVVLPASGTVSPSPTAGVPRAVAAPEGEPIELRAFIEEDFAENFIEIIGLQPERRLVTRIEVLSPSNKQRGSKGWRWYRRQRQALLLGRAHLVEIDLLRGGTRMPMLDPLPDSPYYLLVAREERAPVCRAWPAYFDRPLPTIPVPLTRPDSDISVALQPLVEAIYQRGRYEGDINYTQPLTPPLSAEGAAWLGRHLRSAATPAESSPPRQPRKRQR